MIEEIRKLRDSVLTLETKIKKIKGKQISHPTIKNETQTVVDYFFRVVRLVLVSDFPSHEILSICDSYFQDLLSLTHKNSTTAKYKSLIKSTKKGLNELEKVALVGQSIGSIGNTADDNDKDIIATLTKLLPSAAMSYEQALIDLTDESRLSWRGPAADLRESLRECLDHLAPDSEVEGQPNFKLEADSHGPTMQQKVRYVLKKRSLSKGQIGTSEKAANVIDELLGGFVRSVYTRASISTHRSSDISEVKKIKNLVKVVFSEVLELN